MIQENIKRRAIANFPCECDLLKVWLLHIAEELCFIFNKPPSNVAVILHKTNTKEVKTQHQKEEENMYMMVIGNVKYSTILITIKKNVKVLNNI